MNVLDFINNLPKQADKAVVKPNIEDQCPNLDVVRKQLKQYVLDQPALPDCEINYDLGYVYDPLFKIKDWYCDEYNLDDRRTVVRLSKSNGIANPQRAFSACCRGYIEDPWNTRKYLDEQGNPVVSPGCSIMELKVFNDYRKACKTKDWQGFIASQARVIKKNIMSLDTSSQYKFEKLDEELINLQLKNYYQIDVMKELRRDMGWVYEKDRTVEYHCDVGKFKGFEFYTFKKTDVRQPEYCYGPWGCPDNITRYEINIIREMENYKFWSTFGTRSIDAQTCFELYVWTIRHSTTKWTMHKFSGNKRGMLYE
jgi:hypothetical protein